MQQSSSDHGKGRPNPDQMTNSQKAPQSWSSVKRNVYHGHYLRQLIHELHQD